MIGVKLDSIPVEWSSLRCRGKPLPLISVPVSLDYLPSLQDPSDTTQMPPYPPCQKHWQGDSQSGNCHSTYPHFTSVFLDRVFCFQVLSTESMKFLIFHIKCVLFQSIVFIFWWIGTSYRTAFTLNYMNQFPHSHSMHNTFYLKKNFCSQYISFRPNYEPLYVNVLSSLLRMYLNTWQKCPLQMRSKG